MTLLCKQDRKGTYEEEQNDGHMNGGSLRNPFDLVLGSNKFWMLGPDTPIFISRAAFVGVRTVRKR